MVEGDTLNNKSPALKNATGGIAMNKTENLKLNVWEKSDPILVGDFNEDNRKIDAAVAALQGEHIYVGSYVGDGKENRTIDLPWEPKFAVIFGYINNYNAFSLLTKTAHRYSDGYGTGENTKYHPKLDSSQLIIQNKSWHNGENQTVQYILFR